MQRPDVSTSFQQDWLAGKRPQLETYLAAGDGPQREQLFRLLLRIEIDQRRRAGEQPIASDYLARFPDRHAVIAEELAAQESTDSDDDDERLTRVLERPAWPAAELPEDFGRYRLLRPLPVAGRHAAYLAHDSQADREVVLEVPRPGPGDGPAAARRFVRAARAAAAVQHPHLCPLLDCGEWQQVPYLTRPVLEGPTLEERLRGGPLPPAEAVALAAKLARALQAAHARGVLHRDLTPACIHLTAAGEPIVAGFELARREGSSRETLAGQVLGTPAYLAPERLSGQAQEDSPAADVYSLGAMLYEMLTGEPPFGRTLRELLVQAATAQPIPPTQRRPEVPLRLDAVCLEALARDPAERFASMAELAEALESSTEPAAGTPVDPPDGRPAPRRRLRGMLGAAAALIAGAVALALLGPRLLPPSPSGQPEKEVQSPPGSGGENRTGLLAEFYRGQFDRLIAVQARPTVEVSDHSPLPDTIQAVRWKGFLTAPSPGTYRFLFAVDDAVSLWLDGKLLIDDWRWQGLRNTREVSVELGTAPVPLEIKYFNVHGAFGLHFKWVKPGEPWPEPVPASVFTHDKPSDQPVAQNEEVSHPHILARWVLGLGGKVSIGTPGGKSREVRKLAELPGGPVDLIDLSGCRKATPAELRQLFRDTPVRRLSLEDTPVTDEALLYLEPLRLQELNLSRTAITDSGLPHLYSFSGLRRLELRGTKTTAKGIQDLQAALPQCRIEH